MKANQQIVRTHRLPLQQIHWLVDICDAEAFRQRRVPVGDGAVHFPRDAPVAEMAGDAAAQLRNVLRFGEIHFEQRATADAHGQQVLRALRVACVTQRAVGGQACIHRHLVFGFEPGFRERRLAWADGLFVAVQIGEVLQQLDASTVAMHVAKSADIHQDVEAKHVPGRKCAQQLIMLAAMRRADLQDLVARVTERPITAPRS